MMDSIIVIKSEFSNLINGAENIEVLEEVRISALGKKGRITSLMKNLGKMEPEERKVLGQNLNILKQEITSLLET
jgi:phenylalanyl-tRNA synthetase alpha chain